MKFTLGEVNKFVEMACNSTLSKSCRRIIFNHCHTPYAESGQFHVDVMFGAGSGILLFVRGSFFLLTAEHVLKNNLSDCYQNESPFWITAKSKPDEWALYEFLFPKIKWNIGELVGSSSNSIENNDISLIEMFPPMPLHFPDNYLDLDNMDCVLAENEFFEGQLLAVSGYPFEKNSFEHFEEAVEGITHRTPLHRSSICGVYKLDEEAPYISFDLTTGSCSSENLNGISGGIVFNIQPDARLIKWAGIAKEGGANRLRFIPAHKVISAIKEYDKATHQIIDPAATRQIDNKEAEDLFTSYMDYYSDLLNSKGVASQ